MTTALAAKMTPMLDAMKAQIVTALRHSVTDEVIDERADKALLLGLMDKATSSIATAQSKHQYGREIDLPEAEALALLAMGNLRDLLEYRQRVHRDRVEQDLSDSIVLKAVEDFEVDEL